MILVVGPNLSIDQTVAVPRLEVGSIHRVPEILKLAGGKGTNLARALRALGEEPLLIGFAGGAAGAQLRAYLAADGITARLVSTQGETRACFSIADEATGAQTEFYEAGPVVSAAEVDALLAVAEASLVEWPRPAQTWVALTGSLPRGVPTDLYAQLLARTHLHGARVLLDARGPTLEAGLAAGPALLKINRGELVGVAGRSLPTAAAVAEAAGATVRLEAGAAAVITLGAAGAVVVSAAGRWLITPPVGLPILSPVGSGDATAAGLLAGVRRGLPLLGAARLGVAAGTANALRLGAARFTATEAAALVAHCQIAEWGKERAQWQRALS
ncbi:MAG: hexose kinase [Ktedonobacterales bacterium]|nr:hexose kinase [Ktedonobacterales bacterium]